MKKLPSDPNRKKIKIEDLDKGEPMKTYTVYTDETPSQLMDKIKEVVK